MPPGSLTTSGRRSSGLPKKRAKLSRYQTAYTRKSKSSLRYSKNNPTMIGRAPMLKSGPTQYLYGGANLFGPRLKTRMTWSYNTNLQSTTTNIANLVGTYRLNSLYDPDSAVGGSQPLGFDALTSIYSKYRVTGALVKVTYTNPSADGVFVGVRIRSGASGESGISGLSHNYVQSLKNNWMRCMNNSGSQVSVFKQYVPMNVPWGKTKQQLYDDDEFAASIGGNPAREVFMEPYMIPTVGSTDSVYVSMQVTYFVTFSEPKTQPNDA